MLSVLSPWGATAGAAVGSAVASAAEKLGDSFSFADLLQHSAAESNEPAAPAGDRGIEALREQSQARLTALTEQIAQQLRAAGIPLDAPLDLQVDAFGDLRLASEGHPQAGQIELVLNQNSELRSDLTELRALQTEVARLEFAQRADHLEPLDPRAAAALRRQARHPEARPLQLVIQP
jgi:hypothetical protein